MEAWMLTTVGGVVVLAIGGSVALVLNHEKRIASIEQSLNDQRTLLARLDVRYETMSKSLDDVRLTLMRVETILDRGKDA
jgi:hypothetical protein